MISFYKRIIGESIIIKLLLELYIHVMMIFVQDKKQIIISQ